MNADDRVILALPQRAWRKSRLINAGRIWETLINMLPTVLKCEREDQNPRAVRCMKVCSAIWLIALALVSGGAGYCCGPRRRTDHWSCPLTTRCKKNTLVHQILIPRLKTQKTPWTPCVPNSGLDSGRRTEIRFPRRPWSGSSQEAAMVLEHGIDVAKAAVREFEGTEQQLYVMQDLLQLLDRGGRFELWTEFYLKALHEHPTHSVVCRFAHEAVRISKLAGQQKQSPRGPAVRCRLSGRVCRQR